MGRADIAVHLFSQLSKFIIYPPETIFPGNWYILLEFIYDVFGNRCTICVTIIVLGPSKEVIWGGARWELSLILMSYTMAIPVFSELIEFRLDDRWPKPMKQRSRNGVNG